MSYVGVNDGRPASCRWVLVTHMFNHGTIIAAS
jgi:hypothetical protein